MWLLLVMFIMRLKKSRSLVLTSWELMIIYAPEKLIRYRDEWPQVLEWKKSFPESKKKT